MDMGEIINKKKRQVIDADPIIMGKFFGKIWEDVQKMIETCEDIIPTTPDDFASMNPTEVKEWFDENNAKLLYDKEEGKFWNIIIDDDFGGKVTEVIYGEGGTKFRYGIIGSEQFNSWTDVGRISIVRENRTNVTISPNKYYIFNGSPSSLNISLSMSPYLDYLDEYMFEFYSGSTPTTLTLPSEIKWQEEPEIEANRLYQVSIVNNVGLIVGVNLS